MILIKDWKKKQTYFDFTRSTYNKKDLIHLLSKFFLTNEGLKIKKNGLQKMNRKLLYKIWLKNKPKDFFKNYQENKL